MSRWVIDAEHVVHERHCPEVGPDHLPYRTKPAGSMHAWLIREEIDRGHSAPTMLKACKVCIPVDE